MMLVAYMAQLLIGVGGLHVVAPDVQRRMGLWWTWSVGAVLGMMLTGMLNWLLLCAWPARPAGLLFTAEILLLMALIVATAIRFTRAIRKSEYRSMEAHGFRSPPAGWREIAFAAVTVLLIVGLAQATWQLSATVPHGHWDAWMTWNLRARFLASDGQWRDFYTPAMAGQRQDYPMLLPITVARLWTWTGQIDTTAPRVVCTLNAVLTLNVLMASLHRLRGSLHALLAGLVLLSSGFFLTHATSQYADTLQGLALLVAVSAVLLVRADTQAPVRMWVMLGLLAGLVANVKNEGAVQLIGILLITAVTIRPAPAHEPGTLRRRSIALSLGLALPLAWLLHTKMQAVTGNDMLSNAASRDVWQLLTDTGRHSTIASAWSRLFPQAIDRVSFVLLALAAVVGLCVAPGRRARAADAMLAGLVLLGSLSGAYMAYLLGAADLPSWLAQGSDRIAIQLWPTCVLALTLLLPRTAEFRQWLAPRLRYDVAVDRST